MRWVIILINLNITDKEMREYKKVFLSMDIGESLEDSIQKGIDLGIPLAYFVKTSIINAGNFRDFRGIGEDLYKELEKHFSVGEIREEYTENTSDDLVEDLLYGDSAGDRVEYPDEVDKANDSENEVEAAKDINNIDKVIDATIIEELQTKIQVLEERCNNLEEMCQALGKDLESIKERMEGSIPSYKRNNALMISTYANKGGVGKTTVAISIAKVIAEMGRKTLICDFDFGGRNITAFFDIQDDYGNYFDNLGKLERHLINVAENLYVLPGSTKIQSKSVSGKDIDKLFSKLKTQFDVIVMDTCPAPYEKRYMHTVLSKSDLVFAVVDQNKFSREETKEYGGKLLFMEVKPENIRIILNRYDSNLVSLEEVESDFNKGLGKSKFRVPILAVIPNDWAGVNQATEEGRIANREVWKDLYAEVNKAYNIEDVKKK